MVRCCCGDGWIWHHLCVVDVVCVGFASILDSLTAFKSVKIYRILVESRWFPNLLRFAGFMYPVDLY
ncbi:hypothetical protein A2U01_0065244, partial [Trifolium medium]|nr:hypothetical protein [Trifolium medium]